ncbi:MAG: hypothetical protein M1838_001496 [Thelocarpon superellum]|nr:MAG: hypothetical protein M1838_001496 [Thelocarpon superellum]
MSEYWKSTPRYWCKHCKTYVRDTKIEKQQHEATPKHQGNLKRFLRDLHRGQEREEQDKERAKQEVERLNGVVSGNRALAEAGSRSLVPQRGRPTPAKPPPRPVTAEERKRQLAQLADMGVAIPDEYRPEMAMTGEWQTVSQTIVHLGTGDAQHGKDAKPIEGQNIGVRKRKRTGEAGDVEDDDASTDPTDRTAKAAWGSTIKVYPGSQPDSDDLDRLLQQGRSRAEPGEAKHEPATEGPAHAGMPGADLDPAEAAGATKEAHPATLPTHTTPPIKREDSGRTSPGSAAVQEPQVMFKKRKPKLIRQKG